VNDVSEVLAKLDWCRKEAFYLKTEVGTEDEDWRRRKIASALRDLADEVEP